MFLLLNVKNVIIDIVEEIKPVRVSRSGLTVLCGTHQAEGYIGSDNETIYAKSGLNMIPAYTDIFSMISAEVPVYVKPLAYKYEEGEFVKNEEPYPMSNLDLTDRTCQNSADLEYVAMMTGVTI